ncbi:MAG TPA: hypothetical protein VFR67_26950 [Pilimelia sp.]|nr:hypothetical protein [Pilimelia sp.]
MAILVDFEKVREDQREVEYAFGFPTMDRRLVIEKDSRQGKPLDGQENLPYAKAYATIVRTHRSEGTWPEKGGYAA